MSDNEQYRKVAIMTLVPRVLGALLKELRDLRLLDTNLPEEFYCRHGTYDFAKDCIRLYLVSPSFAPVAEGAIAPDIPATRLSLVPAYELIAGYRALVIDATMACDALEGLPVALDHAGQDGLANKVMVAKNLLQRNLSRVRVEVGDQ